VASATPSPVGAPSPVVSGAGRVAGLPRDPGRATELLYKRHGATVFRYAWHLLGRREDAEDASQATFLAVHRALGSGTAVLEPGAWVLRIARNECLGRLRQRAHTPGSSSLDGVEPRSAGGMERLAEVRDQMRVARDTLRALPVSERDAFVLREWLGLGTAEVALAMSLTSGEIESLAGRARRSLVLAVGGLEPAVGCADTRAALEAGSLGRAGTVHLLRCPMCRGVRRALRPPEATGVPAIVGQRLAGALPGFASGGGGIVAVLTSKAAAAPLLAKTVALVAAALVTVDVAQHEIHRAAPSHKAIAAVQARGGEAHALALAPVAKTTTVARNPVAAAAAPKIESAHAQAVALTASSTPNVRGGGATSVDDPTSSGSHRAFTGHRDGARSSHEGASGSSDGSDGSRHGDTGSGGSGGSGSHEHETSTTPTQTSASDDRSGGSQQSSEQQTSDGGTSGSGHDGASVTSDDSGDGGSTSGTDGTGTIAAATVPAGGDDGSTASGDQSGDGGATTSGDGGDGATATVVTTAVVTTADPSLPSPSGDG
jgi:RNA polymerase sigma factor (sigma-70 family)